jgi:hypothetical protein
LLKLTQGYYVSVDEPERSNESLMIDFLNTIDENPEYLAFVVRNQSGGLLGALNEFLKEVGF